MRNIIKCCGLGTAISAAALLAMLAAVDTSAQVWRFSKNAAKPSNGNSQSQAPQRPVAAFTEEQFQKILDRAIELTSKRYLVGNSHSPWQIFHSILALREKTLLRLGSEKVNAIEWLSTTEPKFDNEPWMMLTPHGAKFHPYTKKYYFEGHPGQFLALLTHSNLSMDHEFHVQGKTVTLKDFINNSMKEVNTREEVTWILWALQHYLPTDASWVNQANEPWSIERLVEIETAQPVVGAPCGGNHRLFALTRARDKHLKNGGRLRGVWLNADQKIRQHIELARSLQNIDGSFSSKSYAGPMHTADINERFNTTGHTMEFLSIALPKERLNEQWVRNAVWMLSTELIQHQNSQIDGGPLFHSLDALILYRERIRPESANPELGSPATEPPQIANPKSDTPLSTNDKKASVPMSIAESSKAQLDAHAKRHKQGIELPPDSFDSAERLHVDGKPNLSKSTDLRASRPVTSSRSGAAKTNSPNLSSEGLPNLGDLATPMKTPERKLAVPRTVDRDKQSNSAPALLPESSARPLLQSESKSNEADSKSESDCSTPSSRSEWRPTSPSRIAGIPVFESPIVHTDDEPVSALEPMNE